MRKIVIYPAKILKQKTEEIKKVDKKLESEINELEKILRAGDNAAGLAAPQIGLNKRFFGSKELGKGEVKVFINPKIDKTYGKKVYPKIIKETDTGQKEEDFLEGCLSFPGFFGTVKRFLEIDVSWDEIIRSQISDLRFQKKKKTLSGFEAIVWQHESDHLEGIVFTDHIKKEKGKLYKDIGGKMKEWGMSF